jgi:hypothetical protein
MPRTATVKQSSLIHKQRKRSARGPLTLGGSSEEWQPLRRGDCRQEPGGCHHPLLHLCVYVFMRGAYFFVIVLDDHHSIVEIQTVPGM